MKCFNKAYSCLWSKSDNGNVEVPYILSEKYGGFQFEIEYTGLCVLYLSPTEWIIWLI